MSDKQIREWACGLSRTDLIARIEQAESRHFAMGYQRGAKDAIEGVRLRLESAEIERDMARAKADRLMAVLVAVHNCLPPGDVTLIDGRVMRFQNPDPEMDRQLLRLFGERIRAIPDELAKERG